METCILNPPIHETAEEFNCDLTPCENLAKQMMLLSLAEDASELRLENVEGQYRLFCCVDNSIIEMAAPPQHMVNGMLQAFRTITNTSKPRNRNRLKLCISDGYCVVQTLFLHTANHQVFLLKYRAKELRAEECLQMVRLYWDAKDRLESQKQPLKNLRIWNRIAERTNNADKKHIGSTHLSVRKWIVYITVAFSTAFSIVLASLWPPSKENALYVIILAICVYFLVPKLCGANNETLELNYIGQLHLFVAIGAMALTGIAHGLTTTDYLATILRFAFYENVFGLAWISVSFIAFALSARRKLLGV